MIKILHGASSRQSLLSLAYLILDCPMQKRFESDPLFEATMLLLQERIPKTSLFYLPSSGLSDTQTNTSIPEMPVRRTKQPDTAIPDVQLLSNGRYSVDDYERRRRIQPMERYCCYSLARGQYLRTTGNLLLYPRFGQWRVLVNAISADTQTVEKLMSYFLRRSCRISTPWS